jgi:hypothetical protein
MLLKIILFCKKCPIIKIINSEIALYPNLLSCLRSLINIRITNIDSFSAYIDRLITERIKEYHFKNKQNKLNEALHQVEIIKIILYKIVNLLEEINVQNGYAYIGEKRTFDEEKITNDVNKLLKELI